MDATSLIEEPWSLDDLYDNSLMNFLDGMVQEAMDAEETVIKATKHESLHDANSGSFKSYSAFKVDANGLIYSHYHKEDKDLPDIDSKRWRLIPLDTHLTEMDIDDKEWMEFEYPNYQKAKEISGEPFKTPDDSETLIHLGGNKYVSLLPEDDPHYMNFYMPGQYGVYAKGQGYVVIDDSKVLEFPTKWEILNYLRYRKYDDAGILIRRLAGYSDCPWSAKSKRKDAENRYTAQGEIAAEWVKKNLTVKNNLQKIHKIVYRTSLFPTIKQSEVINDILYVYIGTTFTSKKEYDEVVITDYKKQVPHLDELPVLVGMSLALSTKKQFLMISGASDAGKTTIATGLGATSFPHSSFKQLSDGTHKMKPTQVKDFAGFLLLDDVSVNDMPSIRGYKTFHDNGITVGGEVKGFIMDVNYSIMTSTHNEALQNRGDEYINRTCVFDLGDYVDIKKSELFQDNPVHYLEALKAYMYNQTMDAYKNASLSELFELQDKYVMKDSSVEAINEEILLDPIKYLGAVEAEGEFYVPSVAVAKMIYSKQFKGNTDVAALWKQFKSSHISKQRLTRRIDGEKFNCYQVA